MRIPPLEIKIMLESNPLRSTMLVGGLAVVPACKQDVLLWAGARPVPDAAMLGFAYYCCV